MNPSQEAKIARFLDDKLMSDSVFHVLQETVIGFKPNTDVTFLAAKSVSLDMLREAWKELEKHRPKAENEAQQSLNVGI